MIYNWDFSLVFARPDEWLRGAAVTLIYAAATIGGGLLIGLVCGIAMLSRHRVLMSPIHFYVQFFRSTPLLIQIVWFYYALPVITGINLPGLARGGTRAHPLHGRLLGRDLPRRDRVDRQGAVAGGASARHAALANDATHHPAAGDAAHVAALRQPVDPATQEHVAALGGRGPRPDVHGVRHRSRRPSGRSRSTRASPSSISSSFIHCSASPWCWSGATMSEAARSPRSAAASRPSSKSAT